jgi:ubiquitin-like protein Pup
MGESTKKQARAAPRSTRTAEPEENEQTVSRTELTKKGEELAEPLDDLLDEIDDVLEENAEDFVKGYVQRGGQ